MTVNIEDVYKSVQKKEYHLMTQ